MSWDLFVQDWGNANTLDEIPDDFVPQSIGSRADIIDRIKEIEPIIDFSDPSLGFLENEYFSIEFSMGDNEELDSFVIHARGSELAAGCIANILSGLKLKAADGSTLNFFNTEQAINELKKWIDYKNNTL